MMLVESDGGESDSESWAMPVLDGSSSDDKNSEKQDNIGLSPEDLARCPGWDEPTIRSYIEQGWTIDQLAEYYTEQME